jgi:predicted nucleic acid-binding Zn ribbon protein
VKRTNDQSLGDAIKEFLQAYRLEDKLNETRLMASWEKVLGKLVANHTTELYIKNRILFVKLDSAALRNELSYAREKIVKALNAAVKADVIEELVLN